MGDAACINRKMTRFALGANAAFWRKRIRPRCSDPQPLKGPPAQEIRIRTGRAQCATARHRLFFAKYAAAEGSHDKPRILYQCRKRPKSLATDQHGADRKQIFYKSSIFFVESAFISVYLRRMFFYTA